MRRWVVLVAGVVLLAALALVIVPVYSRGDAPRTVEEQAESIADTWAAWLWDDCGEALAPETIAGSREELVEGLKARYEAPLTTEQFALIQASMLSGVDGYSATYPPLELELRETVRRNLFKLDYYLAHPFPDSEMSYQVLKQVAEIFDCFQEDLLASLLPLAEDAERARPPIVAGVLRGGVQEVLPLITDPTTPMFKRLFTAEEMANISAAATAHAQQARANLEATPRSDQDFSLGDADFFAVSSNAAHQTANALRRVFWDEWPPMLSADEERQLAEAIGERIRNLRLTTTSPTADYLDSQGGAR